jgi:tetratricopeptide (TPR) repeat protein
LKKKSVKKKKKDFIIGKKWLILILFLGAWLLYGNSLKNDFNMSDDYITINHPLTSQGISAIPEIFKSPYYQDEAGIKFGYRPVVVASIAIENELFGESPLAGHLINVLIYSLTILLVFFWVQGLQTNKRYLLPFLVALLFLLHPVHTEVVNSIKNRDELLALFFSLISVLTFMKGVNHRKPLLFLLLGSFAFALAMMSKLSAFPFALIIPLVLVLRFQAHKYYLIGVCGTLSLITYLLLPPLPIKYQVILISGLFFLPLFLNLIQSHLFIKNGDQENSSEEKKNLISFIRTNPTYIFLLGISACSILSYALLELSLFYPTLMILWSCTMTGLLIFYNKETYPFLILLAALSLVTHLMFSNSIIHLIGLLPLTFYVVSNDWRKNKVTTGSIVMVILSFFLFDIFSGTMDFQEIILVILVGLFMLAGTNNKFSFPLSLLLILSLSSIQLILEGGNTYIFILFLATALYTILYYKGKFSFPTLLIQMFLLGLSIFLLDYPEFLPTNDIQPLIEEDAVGAARAGIRVLDYSESPILYQPSKLLKVSSSILVIGKYLGLLVIPYPLVYYYGYDIVPIVDFMHWQVWLTLILLLILAWIILKNINRNDILSIGLILMLLGIFQFSNLAMPVAGIMGERLIYIASLGFCLAIPSVIFNLPWFKERVYSGKGKSRFLILICIFTFVSSYYIIDRNTVWKDRLTLFEHDIKSLDKSVKAHHLLANEYFRNALQVNQLNEKNRLLDLAISHFRKGIDIYPDFPYAYYDMANAYMEKNDYPNALQAFVSATEREEFNADAYLKAATLFEDSGQLVQAEAYYLKCIEKDNSLIAGYLNLSSMYFSIGRIEEGLKIAKAGLEIVPNDIGLLNNLGNALANSNRDQEALTYFEKIYLLSNNNVNNINKIILLYERLGDVESARNYRSLIE